MADPVTDQPTNVQEKEKEETQEEGGQETAGAEQGVVKSTSWWGVSSLSSYLTSPHLLEQGINNVASSVAQVTFPSLGIKSNSFKYKILGIFLCSSTIL